MALGVDLRRKYASQIAHAGDVQLTKMISSQLNIMLIAERLGGKALCNQVAAKSPAAFKTSLVKIPREDLEDVMIVVIQTISAGVHTPIPVDEPVEEDWIAVMTKFTELGGTAEEITAVQNLDTSLDATCDGTIHFLRAINELSGPSGHRLRAWMGKELAAG